MTISWYGHSCFKIANQGGHLTIITDPFDKKIGLNPPRGNADIVVVSHDHDDHNNIKTITGNPFLVNSPGEYEIKGTSILGCASFHDDKKGEKPFLGGEFPYPKDPHWTKHYLFYEYFNPDTGKGLGASHQSGWTSLVANLIDSIDR